MRRIVLALLAASLSACDLSTTVPDEPTDPSTETFAAGLQVNIATMTKTPNGSYYRDLVPGSGDGINGLPTVVISYQAFTKNGALVGTVTSATQVLGIMIPGLQEGMQGMKPGGERLIVVPSAQAYGNATSVPGVPPNSTLVFDLLFKGDQVQ